MALGLNTEVRPDRPLVSAYISISKCHKFKPSFLGLKYLPTSSKSHASALKTKLKKKDKTIY